MRTSNYLFIIIMIFCNVIFSQDEEGNILCEGEKRYYEVYLPENFTPNMPLVISIHGRGSFIDHHKNYTEMHKDAGAMGFVLVYPQGIGDSWNTGIIDSSLNLSEANDVRFISALIDTMKSHYDIDLSRVYCCGFSLGGSMSFRLLGELGYRFAAAGAISSALFDMADEWEIIRPFPILQMHGTKDIMVPYEGKTGRWPIAKTIDYWLEKNECSEVADTFYFPDSIQSDNCTIQKISYLDCSGDSRVIHYKGINMGHSWPGSKTTFSTEGNKNRDVNANIELLNFFKQFQNPLVNIAYGKTIRCNGRYFSSQKNDTLCIVALVNNPNKNYVKAYASIQSDNLPVVDSIFLYDDGLHNDENESDNIFGEFLTVNNLEEGFYEIKLLTNDITDSISTVCPEIDNFTTAGPLKVESFSLDTASTGGIVLKNFTLRNYGEIKSIDDIKVELTAVDTNLIRFVRNTNSFGEIKAGNSLTTDRLFSFYVQDGTDSIEFTLNIWSGKFVYWHDTIVVDFRNPTGLEIVSNMVDFELEQNYPNPFNPITTIEYTIPVGVKSEKQKVKSVTLRVFDLLGREVATLVNKEQRPGNYELEFNASELTSGIYFYRLQVYPAKSGVFFYNGGTGEPSVGLGKSFVETKKMILLK